MTMQDSPIKPTLCIMLNEKGKSLDKNRHSAVIIFQIKLKLQKSELYCVLLLNYNRAPMNLVIFILGNFF